MTTPSNASPSPKHSSAVDPSTGARAEDVAAGQGRGNGVRVHGAYIVVLSIAALVLMMVGIAITSAMM